MKNLLWESLVASLQSGQCVLMLGPEIPAVKQDSDDACADTEGKSLRDLFCQKLADQLKQDNQNVGELALFAIAQQYEDSQSFSTNVLKNTAASFFRKAGGCGPGQLHMALARCPFNLVLTTCHDDLFEKALTLQGKNPSWYFYHFKGEQRENKELEGTPNPYSPAVYHLFGKFDEPNSLVLTENDLLDFYININSGHPKLPDSLRASLRNKTFLFIGFGIRHWYIRVWLKFFIRSLNISGGSVVLDSLSELKTQEREQTVLFYKRGTRIAVLDLEPLAFVQDLVEKLEDAGGYLGPGKKQIRRAQVFISYERSDEGYAKQLYDSLKHKFDPWLDRDLMQGGDEWNEEIEEKIELSDYFLVLNSKNLLKKKVGYVNKEVNMALELQKKRQRGTKFIIPILIDIIAPAEGRKDLLRFHQLPLRSTSYESDVASIVSTMYRDFQIRNR
jgi:hypothetical protein